MSKVRVLVARAKAHSFLLQTANARTGRSAARTLPAGRCITSKARPPIPIASTPRRPAAGSGRSFNAPTMAAKPGTSPERLPAKRPRPAARPRATATNSSTTRRTAPLTTHQWYDGTQHPWEFKRVWHLEPSLTDPDTVYAGVEDAALFRSTDGGENWHELPGLRGHGTGPSGSPAPAACACTPSSSIPAIRIASTSRSPRPARSAPTTAARAGSPSTRDSIRNTFPNPTAEVGHCVHHIAMNPSRPGVLFMQKHWDVMRSDNAGDQWTKISGNLPTDFGFVIDVHAHEPETIYVVPIKSDGEHYVPMASCASIAAAPAATSGKRSPKVCRKRTAT